MQDMHPLEPAEMIEHLKQGLGKDGQVFPSSNFPITVLLTKSVFSLMKVVCADRTYPRDTI